MHACLFAAMFLAAAASLFGQTPVNTTPFGIRVGEKLTYSVSLEPFDNMAYVEFRTVSRGTYAGRDAVELFSRLKTLDVASAAFVMIDEERTTYAAAETGVPLFTIVTDNTYGLPKHTNRDLTQLPSPNLDLLTMLWKLRLSGGSGTLVFEDKGQTFTVNFSTLGTERVKTDAGEFETSILAVESDYLTSRGISDLRVNISSTPERLPVMFRFKTERKRELQVRLSNVVQPQPQTAATPLPIATPTPSATPTPRPVATPEPYINDRPLAAELVFQLGEQLDYRLAVDGRQIGTFRLEARERRLIAARDSLLLTASVTSAEPVNGVVAVGDRVSAQVDPETLIPHQVDLKLSGSLAVLNQSVQWEPTANFVNFGSGRVEVPVGTHSLMSLVYAMRSFNLKRSIDRSHPSNDTRVAVFWRDKPNVFILRPADPEDLTINGEKIPAQMITVVTQDPQLDRAGLKIWLSADERRVPLRFSFGSYQADLIKYTR